MWGVEISEESVACAIENAELNGITNAAFFAGNVSLALEELQRASRPAGRRRRRPAARRPRREGAAADGAARGAADRLRLVQPDDARLGPEGAARGLRLRAAPLPAGRHVPAHAAHRERQPARAASSADAMLALASRPPSPDPDAGRARLSSAHLEAALAARPSRAGRRSGAGSRARSPGARGGR